MKVFCAVVVILLVVPTEGAPPRQCACASVDTQIERQYGQDSSSVGTLRSPQCLPYRGDQAAVNDGRIYAHVDYHGQPAWVLTADVYIMNCQETFDCVCTTGSSEIKTCHETNGQTLTTLTSGQCASVQGHIFVSRTDMWIPVTASGQNGWIRKGNIVFHRNCNSSPSQHSSVQLPGCPQIITRAEWGARQPVPGIGKLAKTPYYAFVHHGATASCHTRQDCVKMIQSYQNYHMDGHGWNDIGYSFVVGEDGNVYEARGWDEVGAHTRGFNTVGLGICVIGNFMQRTPNKAAQDALKNLIACGVSNGKLTSTYTLQGHRDTNAGTLCPGDMFYAEIQNWLHYNSTVIPS